MNNRIVNLKSKLLADHLTATELLDIMFSCQKFSDERNGFNSAELDRAIKVVIDAKAILPRNTDGKRIVTDEIRDAVSKLLFKVPVENLRRREERAAESGKAKVADCKPVDCGVSDRSIWNSAANSVRSPSSSVPVYIQYSNGEDKNAFKGFVGNKSAIETLLLQINGTRVRGDSFRPILLVGQSGCGKTELATRIAKLIGRTVYSLVGSALKTAEDVDALIDKVDKCSVIFVDETHSVGDAAVARMLTLLNNSTDKDLCFIFATNLSSHLPDAFSNRCLQIRLKQYNLDELAQICIQTARERDVRLADDVAKYIASRCHGIARYAVNYTRDIIVEEAATVNRSITVDNARSLFQRRGIDEFGLSKEHRNYLRALAERRVASSASMTFALAENSVAEIEQVIEPILIKQGLINITGKGRMLTEKGYAFVSRMDVIEEE